MTTPYTTSNHILAEGHPNELRAFLTAVKGSAAVDFNRILPAPDDRRGGLWGTAVNAHAVAVSGETDLQRGSLDITFETMHDTPHGAAIPILRKLVETFPAITFDCSWWYEDEDDDNHPYPHSLDWP